MIVAALIEKILSRCSFAKGSGGGGADTCWNKTGRREFLSWGQKSESFEACEVMSRTQAISVGLTYLNPGYFNSININRSANQNRQSPSINPYPPSTLHDDDASTATSAGLLVSLVRADGASTATPIGFLCIGAARWCDGVAATGDRSHPRGTYLGALFPPISDAVAAADQQVAARDPHVGQSSCHRHGLHRLYDPPGWHIRIRPTEQGAGRGI